MAPAGYPQVLPEEAGEALHSQGALEGTKAERTQYAVRRLGVEFMRDVQLGCSIRLQGGGGLVLAYAQGSWQTG